MVKISDAELAVMELLWREGRPMPFAEIRAALEAGTDWKNSTIQTLVLRLRDKGVLAAENRGVVMYSAAVSREEYVQAAGQSFVDKLFGGSAKNLVAALFRGGQLNEADMAELQGYFKVPGGDGP